MLWGYLTVFLILPLILCSGKGTILQLDLEVERDGGWVSKEP